MGTYYSFVVTGRLDLRMTPVTWSVVNFSGWKRRALNNFSTDRSAARIDGSSWRLTLSSFERWSAVLNVFAFGSASVAWIGVETWNISSSISKRSR